MKSQIKTNPFCFLKNTINKIYAKFSERFGVLNFFNHNHFPLLLVFEVWIKVVFLIHTNIGRIYITYEINKSYSY